MRKRALILTVLILASVTLASCEGKLRADTPINTLTLLENTISNDDYDRFNALFGDWCEGKVSTADLGEFSKLSSFGYGSSFYGVITYSNGEMLLVQIAPEKVDGEYKVENVVKVPEEMKELFK
jgi:hypothetical protein